MSMDFTGLGDRVRSLVAAKKPTELAQSSLTPDKLRDNVIAEQAARSPRFKGALRNKPTVEYDVTTEAEDGSKQVERKQHYWGTWDEAMRDVARAGYGYAEPEVLRPEQMRPSYRLNQAVMQGFLGSEGFRESRPYTRGDEAASLFNALAVQKHLRDAAPERLAEHVARAQEAEEQEEAQTSAQDRIDKMRAQAKSQHDRTGEIDPNLAQDIKDAVAAREAAKGKLADIQQAQAASTMVLDARAAAQEAADAGAEAVKVINSLPGLSGGQSQTMSPEDQLELAEMWLDNDTLKRIAKMLGRLYKDMRFKRQTRTKNVKEHPVSITTGNDLPLVLPMEMARALSPNRILKATWIKDYAQHSLLQAEMSGKEPAGKGPIICVTDGSGSMAMSDRERLVWAQSLALALLTIAHNESRHFAGIQFGSPHQMKSWQFPAKVPLDPKMVLEYAGHFFAGGTSTVTGMKEALRIVQEQPEFSTADIILIGDGQDTFAQADQDIRAELTKLEVRVHGISIMTPNNAYMSQMCEWVRDVSDFDLGGSNDATNGLAAQIT